MISTSSVSDAQKTESYGDLVSYVVRRAICGLPTKNYNNVFLGVLRQLHLAGITPSGLRTILQASSTDASRWPPDAEFRCACLTVPLYPGHLDASKAKGLLVELENGLRAGIRPEEPFAAGVDQLDVDHILPQSWFAHWPLADGSTASSTEASEVASMLRSGLQLSDRQRMIAERQAAVCNLGNLTLLNLSVNRQAQNHAFTVKRDLLIANTTLQLNIRLIPRTLWDEAGIAERGQQLTETALQLWPGPRP